MAPELRKKAAVNGLIKKTNRVEKPSKPTKRKASEDSSPVATKKQKALKDGIAKGSEKKRRAEASPKKTKKSKNETAVAEDKALVLRDAESDADEDIDERLHALATEIDPEDDDTPLELSSEFKAGQDVGKIPAVPKKAKKGASDASSEEPGVVYIGHLPRGFYEHEMRKYFGQFGEVQKVRMSRNRRTGASKHYAFIQFAEASTANIAVKTMDGYLLFGRILKCKIVPSEQIHERLWEGANRRFKKIPWNKLAGSKLSEPLSETAWTKKISKEDKKRTRRAEKLKAMDYEFDAPALRQAVATQGPDTILNGDDEQKAIEPSDSTDGKDKTSYAELSTVAKTNTGEDESASQGQSTVEMTKSRKKGGKGRNAKI